MEKSKNKYTTKTEIETLKVTPLCCTCERELSFTSMESLFNTSKILYCNNRKCKHFGLLTFGYSYEQ